MMTGFIGIAWAHEFLWRSHLSYYENHRSVIMELRVVPHTTPTQNHSNWVNLYSGLALKILMPVPTPFIPLALPWLRSATLMHIWDCQVPMSSRTQIIGGKVRGPYEPTSSFTPVQFFSQVFMTSALSSALTWYCTEFILIHLFYC